MNKPSAKGPVFDPGLCRCCGTIKKCRMLTAEYDSSFGKEVYADMFVDCFGLLLSYLDSKPTERLICAVCVHRLRDAVAFRKQVLQCEEVFLQVRMSDTVDKLEDKPSVSSPLQMGDTKLEVEVLKEEPRSPSSADDRPDCNDEDDERIDTAEPVKPLDTEDKVGPPAKRLRVLAPVVKKIVQEKQMVKRKPQSAMPPKKLLPMSKVQQMIRERDSSYMTLTNILTIVEYSYILPFRCRHNNLLCYYCGDSDVYTDPAKLRDHVRTHDPKHFKVNTRHVIKCDISRVDCRLCDEKITNLEDFKRHITSVHKKPYYFNYKDSVLPFVLKKDDIKCALCDKVFPFFHALNKHMNEHFSNFVCETCGLGFVDIGRFMMHQQRHEKTNYPCPQCGKDFKGQYNRDLHIDLVHEKRGRVYCPKCDVMLMSYHQKLKHLVEVHGDAPMSFPCSMCDKVLESRRSLTIHKRKDHLKDYRYECQCCGQKFFTNFALKNHMPTHTGERNYKCKVCDKSYPRLKTLKEHLRIHTNDRRYRCHVCGQAFIQNCSLKGHMKSQHPEYG